MSFHPTGSLRRGGELNRWAAEIHRVRRSAWSRAPWRCDTPVHPRRERVVDGWGALQVDNRPLNLPSIGTSPITESLSTPKFG